MSADMGSIAVLQYPPPEGDNETEHLDEQLEQLVEISRTLPAEGCAWVISWRGYRDGQLVAWPERIQEAIDERTSLSLKNIFIQLKWLDTPATKPLSSAHRTILFLVPSLSDYHFDKDAAREPHIFKDIEWGGRTHGTTGYHKERKSERYQENGRDPGNVFYETERNKKGGILDVFEYPDVRLYDKLVSVTSKPGWTVLTNFDDEELETVLDELDRVHLRMSDQS